MRPIFLIGFMACGKTTLGRALEAHTGIPFTDTDTEVEREAGMPVSEIFARRGEAEFRRMEADVLRRVCAEGGSRIVACGGGTPCRAENMELMLGCGTVVWLDADTDITVRRLMDAPGQRPLAAGKDAAEMRELVVRGKADRLRYYSCAHSRFDSSRLDTAAEIECTVSKFTDLYLLTK